MSITWHIWFWIRFLNKLLKSFTHSNTMTFFFDFTKKKNYIKLSNSCFLSPVFSIYSQQVLWWSFVCSKTQKSSICAKLRQVAAILWLLKKLEKEQLLEEALCLFFKINIVDDYQLTWNLPTITACIMGFSEKKSVDPNWVFQSFIVLSIF